LTARLAADGDSGRGDSAWTNRVNLAATSAHQPDFGVPMRSGGPVRFSASIATAIFTRRSMGILIDDSHSGHWRKY